MDGLRDGAGSCLHFQLREALALSEKSDATSQVVALIFIPFRAEITSLAVTTRGTLCALDESDVTFCLCHCFSVCHSNCLLHCNVILLIVYHARAEGQIALFTSPKEFAIEPTGMSSGGLSGSIKYEAHLGQFHK